MTTQTLTLTDFLLARIAEDETDVCSCSGKTTGRHLGWCELFIPSGERRLAVCEAIRQQVVDGLADRRCQRILAQPYADHPDYREEWRP